MTKKTNSRILLTIFAILVLFIPSTFALTVDLIKTNPNPIVAGDYADITLRFTNPLGLTENDLENFYYYIDENEFFEQISEDEKVINKFYSGETFTRTIRIYFSEDLNDGFIDLPLMLGFDGFESRKDIRIYVEGAKREAELLIGEVKTTPNKLLQDSKNNKLIVKLQNLGEKEAELVSAKLIADEKFTTPSYSYSFEDSISKLAEGNEKDLEFTIDIEKNSPQEIPAKIELRFRTKENVGNSYRTFNQTLDFNIQLTPSPFLVVEKVELLDDFKIGTTENRAKVTIKNVGEEEAEEVRVRIVPDISYPFIFEETTQYVSAKIMPNQTATVIFKSEITNTDDIKTYDSILILESLVEDSRYSREDIVSIQIQDGEEKDNGVYAYYVVGFVIIISLYLGISRFLRRKKTQEKGKKKK